MLDREDYILKLRNYGIKNDIPNISDVSARFLRDLIKIKNVKNMLEIWSANWFSAINFGIELEKINWKLTTIEFSENSYNALLENINNVSLEKTIFSIKWNALDILPKLEEKYDFLFIDAMKRRTKDFFKLSYNKVYNWWIIIIDDVIKFELKMLDFRPFLERNKISYNILPLDIDDWIMMIIKDKDLDLVD